MFYMTLDIDDALSQSSMNLRQGESGRKISVKLSQSGKPYKIDETFDAVFAGTRPDGQIFFNDCLIDGGNIICDISAQISSVPGLVEAEIRLYSGETLIATPTFGINVIECAMKEGQLIDGPETTALTELIDRAQQAIAECNASLISAVEAELLEDGGEAAVSVSVEERENGRVLCFSFSNLRGSTA